MIAIGTAAALDEAAAHAIPATQVSAAAVLPWFEQRCIDAYEVYAQAKRHLEQARGELAVVQAVGRGEFEQDAA